METKALHGEEWIGRLESRFQPVHCGFTGPRTGMNEVQEGNLRRALSTLKPMYIHHGVCIGADAQAHVIARGLDIGVIGHPPSRESQMASLEGFWLLYEPRPFLFRDRAIVDECALLCATPNSMEERVRSGTWYTIRYARRRGKDLAIFWPDGSVSLSLS